MPKQARANVELTDANVRLLHDYLSRKTVTAYWSAGRLLNSKFKRRMKDGGVANLKSRLKKLGGDAPTSADQLHKCRVLARVWNRSDVAAARKSELPWFRVIVLIFILALGEKNPDKKRRQMIIHRCKKLIRTYPKSGSKERKRGWLTDVAALRKISLTGQTTGMTHRLFNEKRLAVLHCLDELQRRMEYAHELVPRKQKKGGKALLKRLLLLKAKAVDFYSDANDIFALEG
ncbi:MAG: hypothetical protein WCT04_09705 [Planctomycetota bacterium]